ncbi:phage minor tail protein L [Acinetobacter colistiniresistens]|uniref:Phage minor tail protein L n=1 Tax=Acinetobacter colistiniresistens TaxID=280145 RepID=N9PN18_9GAMM|nr:phage minor tail protein L [Acinetobacter colistiniresistens]ENX34893.1 phage minor tail protein L [Acinetobacter colistiniresistens]
MTLTSDFQKLEVDSLIRLYELDARAFGIGVLRFHGHIGQNGNTNIIWQGEAFEPLSIETSGMEVRSDGRASAPTLTIANNINGIQGAISAYCLQSGDFAGAKLKVITTLAKYLDAANFPEGNQHASNESKEQHWYIEQKISENRVQVVFELSNPIDFEGLRIPARQITSLCEWACKGRYRGEECGYIGTKMFTDKNEPTDDPARDRCAGLLKSCRIRHGENAPLPFGGFPASNLL